MLQVPIDRILPVTEARANISKLVDDVEKGDIYVLTRGGKPSVIVSSVEYIKKLTEQNEQAMSEKPAKDPVQKVKAKIAESHQNLPEQIPAQTQEPVSYQEPATDIVKENEQTTALATEEEQPVPVRING